MTRLPKLRLHNVVGMPVHEKARSARNRYDFLVVTWDTMLRVGVYLRQTYYYKDTY